MRKIIYLFLVSILFTSVIHSQNEKKIDSLEHLLTLKQTDKKKIELYRRLFDGVIANNPKKAKHYLDNFIAIANRYDTTKYKGTKAKYKGNYYKRISNYSEAQKYYSLAISYYEKAGNKKQTHKSLRLLSFVQRKLGKYENAIESAMRSLKERELLGIDTLDLAINYTAIGIIHGDLKNYELSNSYFKKAKSIYNATNNKRALANAYMNMGLNYKRLKKYDSALVSYSKSKYIFEKLKKDKKLALLYNNIGILYKGLKNIDSAKYYFNNSLSISKRLNLSTEFALATNNLGLIEAINGNHKKAIVLYNNALTLKKKSNTLSHISNSYLNLSKSYAAINNYQKAYEFSSLYSKLRDSIFQKESIDRINELEVQYQTEKKEADLLIKASEIKSLNQKIEISNLTKTLYGIGMFSFLAIAGLIFFSFKQRIKKNKIAREKQEAIYKQEIAFKKKELTSQTHHLVQKNTFIQELKENLEKIKKSPELFKVEFRRLVMLLKKESAEDKDWEVFKSYFSEVHNNFDDKIKAIANDISEKEIRLASFLRMNLTTKEIASMLNVLPDSVLKSKYRLKKKLNLDKEVDLNAFLNDL